MALKKLRKKFFFRFKLKELSRLQFVMIFLGVCLLVYAVGVFTNFFALPMFSLFFVIDSGAARTVAYVAMAVAVALLTAVPVIRFAKKPELNRSDEAAEQSVEETAEELEKKKIAATTSCELMGLVKGLVRVVDFSFNVLFGLRQKRINWRPLEGYVQDFGEANVTFSLRDRSGLDVDFSKIFSAVNRQVARETAKEAYKVLSLVYGYFNGLSVNGDFDEPHPNFKDSKALILGFYLLNDVLLGMIVGDKKISEEKVHLMKALQDLADRSGFMVDFAELSDALDKVGSEYDYDEGIEYCRELFKDPLKLLEAQVSALQLGVNEKSLSNESVDDKIEGEISNSSMVVESK